jgi:hypothetical protein
MTEGDKFAKIAGFKDTKEMFKLISDCDLSTPVKLAAYKKWQLEDGTKTGLLALGDKLNLKTDINSPEAWEHSP